MKRIAIIDDESDARQALSTLLTSFCPNVEICGEAIGVESGYALIRQTNPHGVLLDITMEDGSGFDLLDKFSALPFQVIFITAHDEFALKAFRYHALDYLLKPINPIELAQAIDRISLEPSKNYPIQISNMLQSIQTQRINKITLSSQNGMVFLDINEITNLQSDGSYTTFHLNNKESHLISRPMKDFEDLLSSDLFFKIHQSHLVNLSKVKKVVREDGDFVVLENGIRLPIARRRKEEFMTVMRLLFT